MKLQHRITATILTIAFATTTALPAANIPQLKNPPKAVTAATPRVPVVPKIVNIPTTPKVPVVKVPAAPKIPVAPKLVKVPSAPKIPATPKLVKVPSAPKVPVVKVPAVKVPVAPRITKVPTIAKAPTTPKVPAIVKTPVVSAATQINTGKLKNLKERIGVDLKVVEAGAKGNKFIRDNFGSVPNRAGSFMDGVKGNAVGHDKNPLSSIPVGGGMVTTRGAAASDDPADDSSIVDDAINFLSSVVGSVLSGAGTRTPAGAVGSATGGAVSGAAGTILTSNLTVEGKKDEANGILGIFRQGKTGTSNENAAAQLKEIEFEPVPDDVGTGSSGIVTVTDIKGIKARKNKAGEPVEEDSGSTGPVNTGANGAGKLGSLSQPAGDETRSAVRVTSEDMWAMQVRINARINTGGR